MMIIDKRLVKRLKDGTDVIKSGVLRQSVVARSLWPGRGAVVEYFDYIIVGGGSAGCVAISQRAGELGASILKLEAGGNCTDWVLKIPPGFSKIVGGTKYLAQRRTVPRDQLGGRVQSGPKSEVLGGGINAKAYMRGRATAYDAWSACDPPHPTMGRRWMCGPDWLGSVSELLPRAQRGRTT